MIPLPLALTRHLIAALLEAFKPEDLDRRVMDPLGVPTSLRSGSRRADQRVEALVAWSVKTERVEELLRVAREANPSSLGLQDVSEALGLMPDTPAAVTADGDFLKLSWRHGLSEVKSQVCLVQVAQNRGAGFLIGPDQVLTHRALFARRGGRVELTHARARIRFGDTPPEKAYRTKSILVAPSAADVVVLRIGRPAGRELTGAGTAARARGWVSLVPPPMPLPDAPVFIVQLTGSPIAVSVGDARFAGRVGDTIRYRTAAAMAATGAPCFDKEWRLLGVCSSYAATLEYGEIVPLDAVLRELQASGWTWSQSEGLTAAATVADRPTVSLDEVLRSIDVSSVDLDDDGWEVDSKAGGDRWAWAEAASVVATFVPERLTPLRPADESARVQLLLESDRQGERWSVPDSLRVRALQRLAQRGELQKARAANTGEADDPIDALLGTLINGATPHPVDWRDPAGLRALRQVTAWLQDVVPDLPQLDDLDAALERATLIAPFRHLTTGFFASRKPDLARIEEYVDAPASFERHPPLLVYGPGGMGKSALLAHYVLARSERDPGKPGAWRPFVYLDFDRPELDALDVATILIAIARQLGPQVPSLAADARSIVERHRSRRHRPRHSPATRTAKKGIVERLSPSADPGSLAALRRDVHVLLERIVAAVPEPILVIFDTLEEVQYSDADGIEPIVDLAVNLREAVPAVRPVLAGRVPPHSKRLKEKLQLLPLGPLPHCERETLLSNQLPPEIARRKDLVSRMADIVGGNPLSLRLAAEALRREKNVEDLANSLGDELWMRVGDAIVQGRLYERILGHIADKAVRAVAYPGLVVRRITSEVIRDVLAKPSGVSVPNDTAAAALFSRLSAEVALVTQGDAAGVLVLRPELRRTVLEDFRRDRKSQQLQWSIHNAAVEFYAKRYEERSQLGDRAEEIYHRLALDEDPVAVDRLWVDGVEKLLRNAVDDFASERARAYLANRVGLLADADMMKNASAEEWEAWAERRASDLVRFGSAARALEILATRAQRLPASRLHLIESVVRRSLPAPDLPGAAESARRAVDAARESRDASYLTEALHELVLIGRLTDDTPAVLRALAELGKLGDLLGDDLVVLQAAVEGLESAGPGESEFSETAIRVFARLPDELVARAPELARRVAAQVGTEDPATLQRVLRLVGTGALTSPAADSLKHVLESWAQRAPEIAAFVPTGKGDVEEIASVAQYLVSSRSLDQRTSGSLANWLKAVATPDLVARRDDLS